MENIDIYVRQICKHVVLDRATEAAAARRFKRGDKSAGDLLVTSNLRFALRTAHRFTRYGQSIEDLTQEANLGLLRALEHYDPARGYRFITYATWWIQSYLRNYVMKNMSLVKYGTTARERECFTKLGATLRKLRGDLPNASDDELIAVAADQLSLAVDEAHIIHQRLHSTDQSLNSPLDSDDGESTFQDMVADDRPPADEALSHKRRLARVSCITRTEACTPRELFIAERRLLADEPQTLDEIGTRIGVTRERVRQIERRLLDRIRSAISVET